MKRLRQFAFLAVSITAYIGISHMFDFNGLPYYIGAALVGFASGAISSKL